ncbi:MAG: glycosyltransferase family 2 protein [Candidatus Margulisiibacteriota bacterium]|jgi:hypothetical protein
MTTKISIIILNWNNWRDTINCLNSLASNDKKLFNVVLIDNGSCDDSLSQLRQWQVSHDISLKILTLNENKGFAEGNNIGIREALKDNCEFILLLNNDTIVEPDCLSILSDSISSDIGIVSPKIMFYPDKNKIWFVGGRFYPIFKKPYHSFYNQYDSGQVKEISEVDWVSGCCLLAKREVLEKIGLLDPDYFNNYEDVDFCVRARKAGYRIVVNPRAQIYHKFAASMGGKHSPFYTYFRTRNNLLFFKKTGQILPLFLNLFSFPVYAFLVSIKNRDWQGVKAVFLAIYDFLRGNYGIGSAKQFQK